MWDHSRVSELTVLLLSRGAATIAGLLLVIATTVSLMRTVVIPRALRSVISDTVARVVSGTAIGLSRLQRDYRRRDSVLAWVGPTTIIMQLLTWLFMYLIAYGLMIYGLSGQALGESIRQAGSSLFTLGFAAVNTGDQTLIDFVAAATGPIVIAMLIGFLPTIYSEYLDREVDVSMLSGQAGEPAWGPELLARYAMASDVDGLTDFFHQWARWAARLRLTHVTYPVLVWVRSARHSRHYLISLLAVMDAAALKVALNGSLTKRGAFSVLLNGGQAFDILYVFLFQKRGWRSRVPFVGQFFASSADVRAMVGTMPTAKQHLAAIEFAADVDAARGLNRNAVTALTAGEEHPLRVTRAEFDVAVDLLKRSGFPIDRDLDEAWVLFRAARSRYEFAAYEIFYRLDTPPAPWSGGRRVPTPVMWPTLAIDILPKAIDPSATSGDDDAPRQEEAPA